MFLSAILAGVFTGFSPFWGLLIIIAYGFRYFQEHNLRYAASFVVAAILSVLFINGQQVSLSLFDALMGVGLVAFIYFQVLDAKRDISKALIYSSVAAAIYGFLRHTLFRQVLLEQMQQNSIMTAELSQELFSDNQEMLQLALQSVDTSISVFSSYGIAIWFLVIISSLFLGIVWQFIKDKRTNEIATLELPYWFVYPLIASMLLFLLPGLRAIGINLLLMVFPLFFIQGIAVNLYFLKNARQNRNVIWITLLLIIFLNYLYFLFLTLLGIAELWLQYRTKHQKKIKSTLNE